MKNKNIRPNPPRPWAFGEDGRMGYTWELQIRKNGDPIPSKSLASGSHEILNQKDYNWLSGISNVSPKLRSPDCRPRLSQRIRCCEVPWVKRSDFTWL